MQFDLIVLGANSANFAYGRHQTAQLLLHNDQTFLIDCGEATQLQMLRYKLKAMRINHIFISHLHGDHYLGLVGLLLTMQLQGRNQELHVYGPPGLDEIITVQLRLSGTLLNYQASFHPVPSGPPRIVHENEHLTVTTIPLQHRVVCNGYLFREKVGRRRLIAAESERLGLHPGQIATVRRGQDVYNEDGSLLAHYLDVTLPPRQPRSYAFCSDTLYLPELASQLAGLDLLYHEATFMHDRADRARETCHTTAHQAAELAQAAGVRKLMLGHYSSRYRELVPLLEEAQQVFPNTILAEEGSITSIPFIEETELATAN